MKIGIIGSKFVIKEVLEKNIPNINIKFIESDDEGFFDIIVLNNEVDFEFKSLRCQYMLIDGDLNSFFINYIKSKVITSYIITYGSNQKATVTYSSIHSEEMAEYQVCIQREFKNFKDDLIYQQEFLIECINKEINSNEVLLISIIQLLINFEVKNII